MRPCRPGQSTRVLRATPFAALSLIVACGGDASRPADPAAPPPPAPPPDTAVASVTVLPGTCTVALGETLRLRATVRDRAGKELSGRALAWSSTDSSVVAVSAEGTLTPRKVGGPTLVVVASAGAADSARVTTVAVPPPSATAASMLSTLPQLIAWALENSLADMPRNPRLTAEFQAKIDILRRPSLAEEIVAGRFYAEGRALSRSGAPIPVTAVFPVDSLRPRAALAVRGIEPLPALLEAFFDRSFPRSDVRVWYGFLMGNRGGGGTIYAEDQGTFEARAASWPTPLPPYWALFDHELAHTFIGHEALTQLLELYLYNVVLTGSADLRTWTYTREYPGLRDSNTGVHAALDIYQLIGSEATARAYRVLYLLAPPYGAPLSAEAQRAFVDQAPDSLKAQVAAKAAKI